jgi:hypothetical protein
VLVVAATTVASAFGLLATANAIMSVAGTHSFLAGPLNATFGPALVFGFGALFASLVGRQTGELGNVARWSLLAAVGVAGVGTLVQVLVVGLELDLGALATVGPVADTLAALLFMPVVAASFRGKMPLGAPLWIGATAATLTCFSAIAIVQPEFRNSEYMWVVAVGFPAAIALSWSFSGARAPGKPNRGESWTIIGVVTFGAAMIYYGFTVASGAGAGDLFAAYYLILVALFANLVPVLVVAAVRIVRGPDRAMAVHVALALLLIIASIVPGWVPPWGNDARTWAQRLGFLDHQAFAGLLLMATVGVHRGLGGRFKHLWLGWASGFAVWAVMTWRHMPPDVGSFGASMAVLTVALCLTVALVSRRLVQAPSTALKSASANASRELDAKSS